MEGHAVAFACTQGAFLAGNGETDAKLLKDVGMASYDALMKARERVKVGAKLLDVADFAERALKDAGFGCAFPVNLSVNNEAAHYTPTVGDEKVFGPKDVVKLDFGAEKEGVLGDCATTIDLSGQHGGLVEAAEEALKNAIAMVRAGVEVGKIGAEIERTVVARGFRPITNLGGHGVEVHGLHSGVFIPNFANGDDEMLEEGTVVAIEPFVTDGRRDIVAESDICEIYSLAGEAAVRSPDARAVLGKIMESHPSEPFAVRWMDGTTKSRFSLYAAIAELFRAGALESHPMLYGLGGGTIAQAEAEVLVAKEGCEVLTRK